MAEVAEQEKVKKAPSEPLFSKKNRKLITDPLTDNNPITIQVLGILSVNGSVISFLFFFENKGSLGAFFTFSCSATSAI